MVRETLPPRTVAGRTYQIQRYRPCIEGLFARIERWTSLADTFDSFWRSTSRDNINTLCGKTAENLKGLSQIRGPLQSMAGR